MRYSEHLKIRTTPKQRALVEKYAEENEMTMGEVVRDLIKNHLTNK